MTQIPDLKLCVAKLEKADAALIFTDDIMSTDELSHKLSTARIAINWVIGYLSVFADQQK